MAHRIRKHLALELFPFLAVLVCVMGALILLVVVSARKLQANAIANAIAAQTARENPQPEVKTSPAPAPLPVAPAAEAIPAVQAAPVPQVDHAAMAAERAALAAQWQNQVASLEQDLEERQTHRKRQQLVAASTAGEIDQLKAELIRLQANLAEAMGRLSAEEDKLPQGTVERALLEKRIAMLREQLRSLERQQVEASSRYSIVAFEGKSGTSRRPILIECTSTGICFQPEGVTLTPTDIDGFTPRFNPLLAGSLALIDYWGRQAASSDEKPYVLLIVRPDGTLAYYIAMKLLAAMKQPYGYELVTDDVQLNLPPSDPDAKAALEGAIERAIAERNQMMNASRSGSGGSGGGGNGGGNGRGNGTNGPLETGRGREGNSGPLIRDSSGGRPQGRNGIAPGDSSLSGSGPQEGLPSPAAGRQGSPSTFSMSDLEQSPQVGERSWQDIDRFEGQQFRRNRSGQAREPAPLSDPAALRSSERPPQRLSEVTEGEAISDPDFEQSAERPAGAPATGEPRKWQSTNPSTSVAAKNGSAGQQGQAPTGSPASSSGGSESFNGPKETSGHSLPDNEQPQYPSFAAEASRRRGQQGKMPYEQLQRRKWGPHEPNASIGVEKPVEIRIDAEQMVVANELTIPIPPGASRTEIFDRLLSAVDQSAQGWGQPGQGFFWVPSLRFVISPGGNAVYERVAPLVVKSGLSRRAEYSLDRVVPAATEVQK